LRRDDFYVLSVHLAVAVQVRPGRRAILELELAGELKGVEDVHATVAI
jgi:hypothetical protein